MADVNLNPSALTAAKTMNYYDKNKDGKVDATDMKILSGGDNIFDAKETKQMYKDLTGKDMTASDYEIGSAELLQVLNLNKSNSAVNMDDFKSLAGNDSIVEAHHLDFLLKGASDATGHNEKAKLNEEKGATSLATTCKNLATTCKKLATTSINLAQMSVINQFKAKNTQEPTTKPTTKPIESTVKLPTTPTLPINIPYPNPINQDQINANAKAMMEIKAILTTKPVNPFYYGLTG